MCNECSCHASSAWSRIRMAAAKYMTADTYQKKKNRKKKKKSASPTHDCGSTCLIQFLFLPAAIPDSQVRPGVLEGKLDNEDIKNVIPEPVVTPPPAIHQQPFDYEGEIFIGGQTEVKLEDTLPEEEEEEEDEDNQLNPRGDVFSKRPFIWLPQSELAMWVVHNILTKH